MPHARWLRPAKYIGRGFLLNMAKGWVGPNGVLPPSRCRGCLGNASTLPLRPGTSRWRNTVRLQAMVEGASASSAV
jgi:hypothetical protein